MLVKTASDVIRVQDGIIDSVVYFKLQYRLHIVRSRQSKEYPVLPRLNWLVLCEYMNASQSQHSFKDAVLKCRCATSKQKLQLLLLDDTDASTSVSANISLSTCTRKLMHIISHWIHLGYLLQLATSQSQVRHPTTILPSHPVHYQGYWKEHKHCRYGEPLSPEVYTSNVNILPAFPPASAI